MVAPGLGCRGNDGDVPNAETPVVVLRPPGRPEVRVRVEVARTSAERSRGLMFREELEPDAGMLFISKDFRVVGFIENAEPQTETVRRVDRPSLFGLEVNAGFVADNGITVGMEVEFLGID